jgi:hypothetical protein
MNVREAAIVTAYTGKLMGAFTDFHEYAEEIMGEPIFTHQFGDKEYYEKVKAAAKPDFLKLSETLEQGK